MKVLLAEDDVNLGYLIYDHLKLEGYQITHCMNGAEAYKEFNEKPFDLCIFDVMMPKKDGFSLAKDIRKINAEIPILFLTAKTMDEDKIEGFKSGGDDYLTKPFNIEELLLRMKSLLKRVGKTASENKGIHQIGSYQFDEASYLLKHTNFSKSLTKKEAKILLILLKHMNTVVPREVVLNGVWGQDDYFVGRSLDVFITKLRKYFSEDATIQIQNIHGVGFKLEWNK